VLFGELTKGPAAPAPAEPVAPPAASGRKSKRSGG